MPEIAYRIRNDYVVPDVYVDGEHASVVSCSYQYVTTSDKPLASTNVFTATILLESENKLIEHVISVNKMTGETWWQ